jgi:hypothetical protein
MDDPYVWTPSDLFGLLQLIVAVLGLAFAGYQLWRTARATEASSALLARRLLTNDLLILLPEVQRLEDAVDRAARSGDRDQTSDALRAYVQRVPTVLGHLKSDRTLRDEKVVRLLSQAVSAAGSAKGDLYERSGDPIETIVKAARKKMMTATIEIGEVTARLQKGSEAPQ